MPDLATAPPTAEVTLPERSPKPDLPMSEAPASEAPKDDSLIGMLERNESALRELREGMPKFQAEVEAQKAQAGAASQVAESAWKQLVEPAIGRMVQTSREMQPKIPTTIPAPTVPDQKPRPFMDVKGKDALGGVVQTLGLMAQMAMAGKAPVGALNALTGAMNGWSEGDHERAQREWRQYLVTVDNIRQENQDNMARWEAAQRQHGANATAAQAEFIGMLAEHKHYDAIAQVAREGMPTAWEKLQAIQHEADKLRDQSAKLLQIRAQEEGHRLAQESLDAMRLNTMAYRDFQMKRQEEADARADAREKRQDRAEGRAEARERRAEAAADRAEGRATGRILTPQQAVKLEQQDIGITQKLGQRERLADAVKALDEAGVIPKGPTYLDRAKAWVNLQKRMGDEQIGKQIEALNRWGTSLLLSSEISTAGAASVFRIKSIAEKEAGNVQWVPKSFWDDFLKDSEKLLTDQRAAVRRTLGSAGVTTVGPADMTYNPATGKLEPSKAE